MNSRVRDANSSDAYARELVMNCFLGRHTGPASSSHLLEVPEHRTVTQGAIRSRWHPRVVVMVHSEVSAIYCHGPVEQEVTPSEPDTRHFEFVPLAHFLDPRNSRWGRRCFRRFQSARRNTLVFSGPCKPVPRSTRLPTPGRAGEEATGRIAPTCCSFFGGKFSH